MKYIRWLFIALSLAACTSQSSSPSPSALPSRPALPSSTALPVPSPSSTPRPTQTPKPVNTPAPPPTSDVLSTLVAIGPSIEVTFDGKKCTLTFVKELTKGEHVIRFTNTSGEAGYIAVGRNYPGTTWQDILKDIGTPGSSSANAINMVLVPWDQFENADENVSYRKYLFDIAGEYHIVVEGQGKFDGIWPCGPFFISETQ